MRKERGNRIGIKQGVVTIALLAIFLGSSLGVVNMVLASTENTTMVAEAHPLKQGLKLQIDTRTLIEA